MTEPGDPRLAVGDLGTNAGIVEDMYREYRRAPRRRCPRPGASSSPTTCRATVAATGCPAAAAPAPPHRRRLPLRRRPPRPAHRRRRRRPQPPRPDAARDDAGRARRRDAGVLRGAAARVVENMEASLGGADGDVGAHHAGQAARGQPPDPEQPSRAHARRQGVVHAHHRLRGRCARCTKCPHELELRLDRRASRRWCATGT